MKLLLMMMMMMMMMLTSMNDAEDLWWMMCYLAALFAIATATAIASVTAGAAAANSDDVLKSMCLMQSNMLALTALILDVLIFLSMTIGKVKWSSRCGIFSAMLMPK